MKRPLLLDLFCGAGGCSMGYYRAGFDIIGIDIKPQKRYPFDFICGDATNPPVSLGSFDAIHASPPCQHYSSLRTMKNAGKHPDLVGSVRRILEGSGKPWVIENVYGAPLNYPVMLCGSFFNLSAGGFQLRRHRFFESSFPILTGHVCMHAPKTLGVYGAKVRNSAQEKLHYAKDKATRDMPVGVVLSQKLGFEAMGINWMKITELSEAIPPAYTEFIGCQLLKIL